MSPELRRATKTVEAHSGHPVLRVRGEWAVTWPAIPGPVMTFRGDDAWLVMLARECRELEQRAQEALAWGLA